MKAPGRAITVFKAVRSFFKANYLPLSCKIPTFIKQREEDYLPTKREVRAICDLVNFETRCFGLVACASGRRDGTIADLTLSHLHLDEPIPYFIVPQKKNKHGKIVKSKRIFGRYGFLTQEAADALRQLIAVKKPSEHTDKVFSCEATAYAKAFSDAAEQLSIYEQAGLRRFRFHNLRERTQTIMEEFIPLNWVDRIIGHKPRGSQADAYSLPPKNRLTEKCQLAMHALTLYASEQTSDPELKELENRITRLEAVVAKLTA